MASFSSEVQALSTSMQRQQISQEGIACRPDYNTTGQELKVAANLFTLTLDSKQKIHRYEIRLKEWPGKTEKRPVGQKLRQLVRCCIKDHLNSTNGAHLATDYSTIILTTKLIPDESLQMDLKVALKQHTNAQDTDAASQYTFEARHLYSFDLTDIQRVGNPTGNPLLEPQRTEMIQALNIIIGHHAKSAFDRGRYLTIGPYYFKSPHDRDRDQLVRIQDGMIGISGFFASSRFVGNSILLNVQPKAIALHEARTLSHAEIWRDRPNADLFQFHSHIKGLRVKVHPPKRAARVVTIAGLATLEDGKVSSLGIKPLEHPPRMERSGDDASKVSFWLNDNARKSIRPPLQDGDVVDGYITVEKYFLRRYGIKSTSSSASVINVGTLARPSYMLAQFCTVEPGQPIRRTLTPDEVATMGKVALRSPGENARLIRTSAARDIPLDDSNTTMVAFKVSCNPSLKSLTGRVLKEPTIRFGTGKSAKAVAFTGRGKWNLRNVKMSLSVSYTGWHAIWLLNDNENDTQEAHASTFKSFAKSVQDLGIRLDSMPKSVIFAKSRQDFEAALNNQIDASKKQAPKGTFFYLVILPDTKTRVYNSVKAYAEIQRGVHTLCITRAKISKGINPVLAANLGLKLNLKRGGRNQVLDSRDSSLLSNGDTMIVGMDVTHPAPDASVHAPSVAGSVASIDCHAVQYHPSVYVQQGRQEMVECIGEMMKSHLRHWETKNNARLPAKIIIYRDGVSDGQYLHVLNRELPEIQKACRSIYVSSKEPKYTVVVVGKRHHIRFYQAQNEASTRGHLVPGFVVDDHITEPKMWDFYLQSHTPLAGTARPAHYVVLYDEIFRSGTYGKAVSYQLQQFTFNLCYLFGRSTSSVSIPPPVYWADRLCDRARRHLNAQPQSGTTEQSTPAREHRVHAAIQNTMWFV